MKLRPARGEGLSWQAGTRAWSWLGQLQREDMVGPTQAAWRAPPPAPDKLPHSTGVCCGAASDSSLLSSGATGAARTPGTPSRGLAQGQGHGNMGLSCSGRNTPGVDVLICCSAGTMAGGCIQGRAAAHQNSLKGAELREMHDHRAGDPSRAGSSCHLLHQHSHTYH